ncbi:MAG: DUF1538 domain-containing protein [Dehalococcoidia bacterium]|nr:DUF1538 domain-containing protein [Dehalococcoidia bacterium]
MRTLIKDKAIEVIRAITPLIAVVILMQVFLVKAPAGTFMQFLISALMVIAGMTLFLLGIEVGILNAGKTVGTGLAGRRSVWLIIAVAFLIGFAVAIAEPAVIVLSQQADTISQGAIPGNLLMYVIGLGLAFFGVMAMMRIILGFPIAYILALSYAIVIILSFFTPTDFIALAFDSGSVSAGALAAPIIISLGIGLSSVLSGRSALSDGFGLVGLASVGPIIAVMIMGIILH